VVGVKVVMLDLDETLIGPGDSAVQDTVEMTQALKAAGLTIVVTTGRRGSWQTSQLLNRHGYAFDLVEDKAFANGQVKGRPDWVQEICKYFKVQTNEIVYLGDTDNDMRSAVNGRLMYFHAGWTGSYPYGLRMTRPKLFSLLIAECFVNPSGWYWQLQMNDACGRSVDVRALMDSRGAGISAFQNDMLGFLKDGKNPMVGPMTVGNFITFHLLGNLYADGLFNLIDTWAVYPSSKTAKMNRILRYTAVQMARLFRDRPAPLLVRHTNAVDSGEARKRGITVGFDNQINTVHLDAAYAKAIDGRYIALLDDFMTAGYSMECARNLLSYEGAAHVLGINFCKYSWWPEVITPKNGYSWDGYAPTTHDMTNFDSIAFAGTTNATALATLNASYKRVSTATI